MGYHSITKFYKTLKFNSLCSKTSKCNINGPVRASLALTTGVTYVDN